MNLVIQKLAEINEVIKQFRKKEMSVEEVQAYVSLVNAAHKWANLTLQSFAIESKNRRVFKELRKMNIIDTETALNIGISPGEDLVKCPSRDNRLVKREECLDYSGVNNDECRACDQFSVTRERLT